MVEVALSIHSSWLVSKAVMIWREGSGMFSILVRRDFIIYDSF